MKKIWTKSVKEKFEKQGIAVEDLDNAYCITQDGPSNMSFESMGEDYDPWAEDDPEGIYIENNPMSAFEENIPQYFYVEDLKGYSRVMEILQAAGYDSETAEAMSVEDLLYLKEPAFRLEMKEKTEMYGEEPYTYYLVQLMYEEEVLETWYAYYVAKYIGGNFYWDDPSVTSEDYNDWDVDEDWDDDDEDGDDRSEDEDEDWDDNEDDDDWDW